MDKIIVKIAEAITYRGDRVDGKGIAKGQIALDVKASQAYIWAGDTRHQVHLLNLDKLTPFVIGKQLIFENDIIEFEVTFKGNLYTNPPQEDEVVISQEVVTYNEETGGWYGVQTDGLTSDPYLPHSFQGAKIVGRKKLSE